LESIVDRFLELLPAPDVSFRRLHGCVTEKKLNLFEFASRAMAEPSTGTTKVMRREMVHADPLSIVLYECPNNVRRDSATQFGSIFQIRLNTRPSVTPELRSQLSIKALHQSGTGTVRSRPPLPNRSAMTQWPSLGWI
jgi:hypothetical protein